MCNLQTLLAEVGPPQGAARRYSLPPGAYAEPAFFEREVERIFRREWISIAHASQLPRPGDFLTRDLFGEPLVVTRDLEGEIHVLSRTCLHRWAEIVSGAGNAKGFVCPFHAWSYGLDGRLLGAPVTQEEADFDASGCRLPAFRHEIVDGFVFVNLDGEAPPLAPQMTPISERFAAYRQAELLVAGSLTYDCAYNWKILVETFMESYHHIGVHQETLEPQFPGRGSFADRGGPAYGLLHSPSNGGEMPLLFPLIEGLPPDQRDRFFTINVYPFHLVAFVPDLVVWFRTVPLAADRCELETVVLLPPETLGRPDIAELMPENLAFLDQVNREDIAVNVSQQIGLASQRARPGRLNRLEACNRQFADYIAGRVA